MRAVLCTAFEGADALTVGETPDPQPADDEVLIEVRAASVSYMDKLMTEGGYQMRPELPYSPGTEVAGVIVATGAKVKRFKPGDRVAGQLWHGGYAEKAAAKEWRCAAIPGGVDFATASTVLHNYLTAYHALVDRCALKNGEFLLVTGATGGVGLAVMDMGRMLGAKVIAGIGSDAKIEIAMKAGAFAAVNYRAEDLRARITDITGGKGLDVCLDMIGGDVFLTLARAMAWGGRISPIGFVGGDIPALPMNLPLLKSFSVVGVFCGAWLDRCPREAAAAAEKVMGWIAKGALSPRVDRIMPLEQAAEAMRILGRREVTGRIVLEPFEGSAIG